MSWDVMLFHLREKRQSADEINDENLLPLGAAAEVREAISRALGGVDWSDRAWGRYEGDGYTFEFNVGADDPIQNAMVHVRGGGDAVSALANLATATGWVALDCSTSELIDPAAPTDDSWVEFQQFRDKILSNPADVEDDESKR